MAQNDEITLVITTSSYNLASLASNRGGPPDADTSAFAIHFAVGGPFGLGCIFGITQKKTRLVVNKLLYCVKSTLVSIHW